MVSDTELDQGREKGEGRRRIGKDKREKEWIRGSEKKKGMGEEESEGGRR